MKHGSVLSRCRQPGPRAVPVAMPVRDALEADSESSRPGTPQRPKPRSWSLEMATAGSPRAVDFARLAVVQDQGARYMMFRWPIETNGATVALSPTNEKSPTVTDSPNMAHVIQQWLPIRVRKPIRVLLQITVFLPIWT